MSYTINAQTRTEIGKGSSRRLRHAGQVPAVIYGAGQEPVSIKFAHKDIINIQLNDNFYTSDLTIVLDGKEIKVRVQDVPEERDERREVPSPGAKTRALADKEDPQVDHKLELDEAADLEQLRVHVEKEGGNVRGPGPFRTLPQASQGPAEGDSRRPPRPQSAKA